MGSLKANLNNKSYLHTSVATFLIFVSWGLWWAFYQLWLTRPAAEGGLGFDGAEVGVIYAANSVVTLVLMLFYGFLQDRLGTRRHLAIFIGAMASLTGPFMNFVYGPLLATDFGAGVVVGSLYLSFAFLASVALMEAIAERLARVHKFEYGQARMWGSIGYATSALVGGFLFSINPALNFWMSSLFGLALLFVQAFWKVEDPNPSGMDAEASHVGLKDMLGLLKMKELWAVILFVFGSWTFYSVYDQQMFPDFYTGLFASKATGERVYGMLSSGQVFIEASMMGLVPVLMRKVGVRTSLLLGVSVMTLRILGSAIFVDPVIVSGIKVFQAIEIPLFILPIFRYFTLHFNPLLSATLYMIGFQIAAQVGTVVLSPPMGALRDSIGYQPTFFIISAIVGATGVYAYFVLKKDDEDVWDRAAL